MKKTSIGLCLALLFCLVTPGAIVRAEELPPQASQSAGASASGEAQAPAADEGSQTDLYDLDDLEEETPTVSEEAKAALQAVVDQREVMALIYLVDEYTLRQQPSNEGEGLATLPSGRLVLLQEIVYGADGILWGRVLVEGDSEEDTSVLEGYVTRTNLAISDERFLAWEGEYDMAPPVRRARAVGYPDVAQFPADYQASLMALKQTHPNWTFVKQDTKMDFNWVVQQEMQNNRSMVPSSFDPYMKSAGYDQNWSIASDLAVRHYLDPRNWVNEEYIFGYEQLTYNASYHTEAAVQACLNGSFMQGVVPQDSRSYARVFWEVGQGLGVSPYHLATRAYFEQGVNGKSALISGTYPGYEGLYNYYNIGASGQNAEVVKNGLGRARQEGWNTPVKSIQGGAERISRDYVRKGQDTIYLQKFNVGNGNFGHQYQQSILAPAVEGRKIREFYANAGALNNTFVFKIPVYSNMPQSNCTLPGTNYNITLTPPAGYNNAVIYINGAEHQATQNGGQFTANVGGAHGTTASMYKYDANGIPTGMYVWTLNYRSNNAQYTVTPQPQLENLLTYHGFSVRITGKPGVRVKSGISADLRNRLATSGVNGFWLRECGTVVMRNINRPGLPLIKAGDKVSGGISYGNVNGKPQDVIYETVDGRHRFTSVFVGLPATEYKTEFAFRGYTILTQGGKDYIFYGPPVSRSLYAVANQALASGAYPEGTPAGDFLRKLIQDAG